MTSRPSNKVRKNRRVEGIFSTIRSPGRVFWIDAETSLSPDRPFSEIEVILKITSEELVQIVVWRKSTGPGRETNELTQATAERA